MASWDINKGIGRTVEFKGLKAQYLFLFAGGLLAVFVLVVVWYESVAVLRYRLSGCHPRGVANVCHEPQVWSVWTDEARGNLYASALSY